MLDICLTLPFVPINYMQMLLDLMEERQKWLSRRDESIREISRLDELIRVTMKMIPAEQVARYEPIFERIEKRPPGLAIAIRACFTAGAAGWIGLRAKTGDARSQEEERQSEAGFTGSEKDGWLTPVQIRDALKNMGFPFENYKANPLASIHTTLKRMVPGEIEVKTLKDGQKVYRLKSAGDWAQAFAEVRQWLRSELHIIQSPGTVVAVRRSKETGKEKEAEVLPEEKKRGTSGSA